MKSLNINESNIKKIPEWLNSTLYGNLLLHCYLIKNLIKCFP